MTLANLYDCFKMIYSFEEYLQLLRHFHYLNYFLGLILILTLCLHSEKLVNYSSSFHLQGYFLVYKDWYFINCFINCVRSFSGDIEALLETSE